MQKNKFLVALACAFILTMSLGLMSCNDNKGVSVAVVDPELIFGSSKNASLAMQFVNEKNIVLQTRFSAMQKEIIANPEDTELEKKVQTELIKMQTESNNAQLLIFDRVNTLFEDSMNEYRAKNNIQVLLLKQMAVSYDNSLDVTDKIIAIMDAKTLDLSTDSAEPKTDAEDIENLEKAEDVQNMPE